MAAITTPEFRGAYVNVIEPQENPMNGQMEYSLVALFPKGADLTALKKAAQEALEKKWGKDQAKWPSNLRSPFRDGGEKAKVDQETGNEVLPAGFEEGAVFMTLKSANKPGLVDQNVQDIIEPTQVYSGAWYRASINAYAYDKMGNRGVNFGLNNVQKVRDDDPLGNRTRPQDDFAPVETDESPAGGETAAATSMFD